MSSTNALESIYFIEIPENFNISDSAFPIDKTIKLPVQRKTDEDPGSFNPEEITTEQVLAGLLTVLAYDKKNPHLDYYRSILKKVKPNLKKELCEAAILKTKNEDWDLAEEIFMALYGFDPEDEAVVLNYALFLDQRADSYRRNGLFEDADAYDNDALSYYLQAMEADPPLTDAFFNAGFFYLKQHKYREAKDCFDSYLALTVDLSDEDLGENGIYKKERASEIVNNIKSQNMDDVRFSNAYELIMNGEEEKGLEEIRVFLQSNPDVWNGWFLLGWGLRKIERFADARLAFEEAVKYGADNSDTFNELAYVIFREKILRKQKKIWRKPLQLNQKVQK